MVRPATSCPPTVTRAVPVAVRSSCTLFFASAGRTRRTPLALTAKWVLYLGLRQLWAAAGGSSGLQEYPAPSFVMVPRSTTALPSWTGNVAKVPRTMV